jgi:3-dehydroquinate synthase
VLWRRWGVQFGKEAGLRDCRVIYVPPGERSKSLAMVERMAARLLAARADRRSLLVAFGGGVVGDLSGFIASTYMRGIDLVQAPTTVVAQVDSAIGGKTGVNVGAMKNLVGTFYPPRLVLADPVVLRSLGPRAFRSGLYEIAKHAMLAGGRLFNTLENEMESLTPRNAKLLGPILAAAAAVKVAVVKRDEREARLRFVLNLGHTFGHALEEATAYRRFTHGEAVGWGLLAVLRLAKLVGALEKSEEARMAELVRRIGPLPSISDLDPRRIVELLRQDKKTIGGRIHWVIPERVGKVRIMDDVPIKLAATAFREVQASFAS